MIKTENYYIGNREFIRTYSDSGMKIHGGFPEANYDIAEDPANINRMYTETDVPVESNEAAAEELLAILTGDES